MASVTVGTSPVVIVQANPTRRKLVVCVNTAGIDVNLSPVGQAETGGNVLLSGYGAAMVDEPDATGWMHKGAWTAIASAAGTVGVTEL